MNDQISPYGQRWVGSPAKSDERFLVSLDAKLQNLRRRFADGENPVDIRRDVETLCNSLTCSERPKTGYYDEPNTLLRPDWRETWRKLGEFDDSRLHSWLWPIDIRPATEPEKCWTERTWGSLREVFHQMIRFVVEGMTDYQQHKIAGELHAAIEDYLDARGYDVPPVDATNQQAGDEGPELKGRADSDIGYIWFTVTGAADYIGVSDKTVRRWIIEGTLYAHDERKPKYKFEQAELDKHKASQKKSAERREVRNSTPHEKLP